ncbi:class II aldolase/adducin family protein [Acidimicrobium ferrooxidans DSM 10331]|uniref:Class II aldolase/adducin family protein n=1 Tax=Acidimicrobium ferrooxidans (strain DSM 10331 / JCM 15462 / NBRC 103882 / ICP) TaxID=525909 RepID=C7M1N8_ACIFD|nr:class II aldolase/adducin family protein [Acidimicrobium ferrooxidans]ACU54785.1 class II aldolase/adducin family protein [Acidimicrobium ferrooxidans DSM 10331]
MTTWLSRAEAASELVAASALLFEAEVMSRSGHGNLSCRIGDDTILMTSSGSIRNLDPSTLAVVGLDGTVREGAIAPENAEIIEMHTQVYRLRPELGAIIHTHSPNLTAFAYAHEPLPIRSEPMLRFGQAVAVPVAPWAPRGSHESVGGIVEALRNAPESQAVLLANHGLLALGAAPTAVARLIVALEEAATEERFAAALGGAKDFPADALAKVQASMARVR